MTLARDLADHYPSFKIALGKVVKDNTALRVGTRDYDTLFESLIFKSLKDLHIVDRILLVIDAFDESGDTTGRTGLHAFLAENLKRLPSNFRVVITSRPKHAIVSALGKAPSVKIKYMDDSELATETEKDILMFLQEKLPSNTLGDYVESSTQPLISTDPGQTFLASGEQFVELGVIDLTSSLWSTPATNNRSSNVRPGSSSGHPSTASREFTDSHPRSLPPLAAVVSSSLPPSQWGAVP